MLLFVMLTYDFYRAILLHWFNCGCGIADGEADFGSGHCRTFLLRSVSV